MFECVCSCVCVCACVCHSLIREASISAKRSAQQVSLSSSKSSQMIRPTPSPTAHAAASAFRAPCCPKETGHSLALERERATSAAVTCLVLRKRFCRQRRLQRVCNARHPALRVGERVNGGLQIFAAPSDAAHGSTWGCINRSRGERGPRRRACARMEGSRLAQCRHLVPQTLVNIFDTLLSVRSV